MTPEQVVALHRYYMRSLATNLTNGQSRESQAQARQWADAMSLALAQRLCPEIPTDQPIEEVYRDFRIPLRDSVSPVRVSWEERLSVIYLFIAANPNCQTKDIERHFDLSGSYVLRVTETLESRGRIIKTRDQRGNHFQVRKAS